MVALTYIGHTDRLVCQSVLQIDEKGAVSATQIQDLQRERERKQAKRGDS